MASKGNGGVDLLRCGGDLDASMMVRLKGRLSRLLAKNHRHLVLDFGRVRHVDLAGLGILVERLQKVRAARGDIRFARVRPEVSEAFRMVGLHHVIRTFGNFQEAARSFRVA